MPTETQMAETRAALATAQARMEALRAELNGAQGLAEVLKQGLLGAEEQFKTARVALQRALVQDLVNRLNAADDGWRYSVREELESTIRNFRSVGRVVRKKVIPAVDRTRDRWVVEVADAWAMIPPEAEPNPRKRAREALRALLSGV